MSASIPSLLPNEFIGGYLSRLATSSGKVESGAGGHRFGRLMSATGFDAMSVVYGHSCIAYARFVSATYAGTPTHLQADLNTNPYFHILGTAPSLARCCELCLRDDIELWGCGYWRRDHQLPGVELCNAHQIELVELPRPVMRTPLTFATLRSKLPSTRPVTGNSVLRRFETLTKVALTNSGATHPRQMADALARRAADAGIRVRDQRKGRRLSEVVRDHVPATWLSRHFRGFTDTLPGSRADTLDGVFRARSATYRTASYLLAMALLWECPQEALATCVGQATHDADVIRDAAGLRVLKAVLAGESVRTACRREHATALEFENALRRLLPQGIDAHGSSHALGAAHAEGLQWA